MPVTFSNPDTVAKPDGDFSQAAIVEAGSKLIHISGQVPRAANGKTVAAGNITAQAEQVFENLRLILEAHGSTFADAVKATIFVTDMTRAGEVAAVRQRFYGDARPASTFVGVSALGDPDWLLEIQLIAEVKS
jgi:enamine deaminase RidA (YjgF/YER057c/UK114 family)